MRRGPAFTEAIHTPPMFDSGGPPPYAGFGPPALGRGAELNPSSTISIHMIPEWMLPSSNHIHELAELLELRPHARLRRRPRRRRLLLLAASDSAHNAVVSSHEAAGEDGAEDEAERDEREVEVEGARLLDVEVHLLRKVPAQVWREGRWIREKEAGRPGWG